MEADSRGYSFSSDSDNLRPRAASEVSSEDGSMLHAPVGFPIKFAKRLWESVKKEEAVADKKRRWLLQLGPRDGGERTTLYEPKCFADVYLPESLVRNDASYVKTNVEGCFVLHCDSIFKHGTLPGSLDHSFWTGLRSILQKLLEKMSLQELVAVNRKLHGQSRTPEFLPATNRRSREQIIRLICAKFAKLYENADHAMLKDLAKTLSVVHLILRANLECSEVSALELWTYSEETIVLKGNILKAIWYLPNLTPDENKHLKSLLDQECKVSALKFSSHLKRYLTEVLVECGDIPIPGEAMRVIAIINQMSQSLPLLLQKKSRVVETEAVLNLSCTAKSIVSQCIPEKVVDECLNAEMMDLESVGFINESDSFDLPGTNYFGIPGDCYSFQMNEGYGECGECSGLGAPKLQDKFTCSEDAQQSIPDGGVTNNVGNTELRTVFHGRADNRNSMEGDGDGVGSLRTGNNPTINLEELCDKTALLGHKMIGRILHQFASVNNQKLDQLAEAYLENGSSLQEHKGNRRSVDSSNCNMHIVLHVVEDILPSLPKSCMDKVKSILGIRSEECAGECYAEECNGTESVRKRRRW